MRANGLPSMRSLRDTRRLRDLGGDKGSGERGQPGGTLAQMGVPAGLRGYHGE
jgi:hypothetical protein